MKTLLMMYLYTGIILELYAYSNCPVITRRKVSTFSRVLMILMFPYYWYRSYIYNTHYKKK